jgi:hypothetical protein
MRTFIAGNIITVVIISGSLSCNAQASKGEMVYVDKEGFFAGLNGFEIAEVK